MNPNGTLPPPVPPPGSLPQNNPEPPTDFTPTPTDMNTDPSPLRSSSDIDLYSMRAEKARFARQLGSGSYLALKFGILSGVVLAIMCFLIGSQAGYMAISLALACYTLAVWYKRDLEPLPPKGTAVGERLSATVLGRLRPRQDQTPQTIWTALANHWQANFILNHLLLPANLILDHLSNRPADMDQVWREASRLADTANSKTIEPGHVVAGLMVSSPALQPVLSQIKLTAQDVEEVTAWLGRILELQNMERPFFGGIGRDWANGFTPMLGRFGHNISLSIEHSSAHFGALADTPGVGAIQNSFAQGASAVALVGSPGIGKTSHIYALAQLLLEGKVDQTLAYHQIIELNPSVIISSAQRPGELEHNVLTLLQEAVHAGHIILFLDNAQLFFGHGPGSFDMTQILLPAMQSGKVRLIMAMTPSDFQRLKAQNAAFANLLTPVMLTERPQNEVMDILEDTALGMEHKHGVLISYDALREAYRLSERYEQETAYPGKAIQLLEQSLTHAQNGKMITDVSVQQAIEQTRGVKVGSAAPVEADTLLHLEDKIHARMINQTRAVQVVASALRRARAGVSSPTRPIGSFLFLGPTGVGKTELAKAIAATYFGSEANMVRLDMSEYQQQSDVSRLLSDGKDGSTGLVLAVRQQPFTVVLLDEIEKAHPNILNLLLQMLDEGALTDVAGRKVSFKDCIIIATSNAGADAIRQRIEQGEALESFEKEFTDQLINSGQFKPELLNRFDEIVLFRPLNQDELGQVVKLMLTGINKTLSTQNISVELTDAAVLKIVQAGYDPRLGARPMRRMLQRAVEDGIAGRILRGETRPGDHVILDAGDLSA